MSPADRKITRCHHCKLRQFAGPNKKCARCGTAYTATTLSFAVETPKWEGGTVAKVRKPHLKGESFLRYAVRESLAQHRHRARMSQHDVAAITGWPRTYISKMENQKCIPTIEQLAKFAAAVRTTLSSLVYDIEQREFLLRMKSEYGDTEVA